MLLSLLRGSEKRLPVHKEAETGYGVPTVPSPLQSSSALSVKGSFAMLAIHIRTTCACAVCTAMIIVERCRTLPAEVLQRMTSQSGRHHLVLQSTA